MLPDFGITPFFQVRFVFWEGTSTWDSIIRTLNNKRLVLCLVVVNQKQQKRI